MASDWVTATALQKGLATVMKLLVQLLGLEKA